MNLKLFYFSICINSTYLAAESRINSLNELSTNFWFTDIVVQYFPSPVSKVDLC